MQMLYNSDSYAVVIFEVPADPEQPAAPSRGGYELVDKFAGKQIYISGVLAETFKTGVQAVIDSGPSEEEMDDYIERFSALMQQPLVLH